MGIYIKGMKMPTIGYHKAAFVVWGDGTACLKLEDDTGGYGCIPVPDHGRLIDADELIKHDNQHYEYMSDEYYVTVRDIQDAPTIIPAEEDKRDYIEREAAATIPVLPKEYRKQTTNLNDAYENGWYDALECVEKLPSYPLIYNL